MITVRSTYVALLSLAALGGCAWMEQLAQPEEAQNAPAASAEAPAVEVPVPARKPVPPLHSALPTQSAPPAPVIEPEWLEQLTPEQALALFGEPTLRSERGSGVIWSYVRASCELDLHFFMNVQTKVSRVLDYDLRAGDGSDRSRQRCLEQLALERRDRASGTSNRPR